ncbi:MAG: hypothetical protein U1F10_07580 [Burkholderiales bacterium]
MNRPALLLQTTCALLTASIASAIAADMSPFTGTWTIARSVEAPWKEPDNPVGTREDRAVAGKTVVFAAGAVRGPSPIGCTKPVYNIETVPADGIFEGMLGEPRKHLPKPDAAAAATRLGFADPAHIVRLDPGCTEIMFAVVQPGTLAFALNNRVYYLTRRP